MRKQEKDGPCSIFFELKATPIESDSLIMVTLLTAQLATDMEIPCETFTPSYSMEHYQQQFD